MSCPIHVEVYGQKYTLQHPRVHLLDECNCQHMMGSESHSGGARIVDGLQPETREMIQSLIHKSMSKDRRTLQPQDFWHDVFRSRVMVEDHGTKEARPLIKRLYQILADESRGIWTHGGRMGPMGKDRVRTDGILVDILRQFDAYKERNPGKYIPTDHIGIIKIEFLDNNANKTVMNVTVPYPRGKVMKWSFHEVFAFFPLDLKTTTIDNVLVFDPLLSPEDRLGYADRAKFAKFFGDDFIGSWFHVLEKSYRTRLHEFGERGDKEYTITKTTIYSRLQDRELDTLWRLLNTVTDRPDARLVHMQR